ncbi:MAG: SDR family oxidoreductase [Gemmobacter sp.]|nr:SDR family oxidoreductase [Gemmobacter sp.]
MSRILITGAAGMVGSRLLPHLVGHEVVATDIRPIPLPPGMTFAPMDVRGDDPDRVIADHTPDVVVHLASIVTPARTSTREFEYAVDVTGTQNVLSACVRHGVRRLVVTSSGAAYGYHPENRAPLTESAPIRGNPEFAYAHHKRLVEEMLAAARTAHPDLEQVVLRIGTVLGVGVENQITALFRKPRLLAIRGSDSAFVFIWTEDLARILARAATDGPPGIFNVAGDGTVGMDRLAAVMGKPMLRLPAWALRTALAVARPLGLTPYGPEQVRFLQYRPVLDNSRLKSVFGYTPQKTSAETFDLWWRG